ncbi:hypothetical protein SEA_ABIGAIL_49 [Microbacterium phage Abigail]|uniref:hypothetical protein n=1 Tax=Microbacterium phage Abigail TaxID=2851101 RepID=UPI001C7505B6|nr:hypothetical protein QDW37_gp49 [Microbacterium phage Abigail]QXN73549.1 hypothetical protein SEA_ABIGAIL_49 [Microbacterium phage Abigail]WIC89539.1 hypothetical protein SEA_LIMABEAN_50 [Microbacterium phage LimaBean]
MNVFRVEHAGGKGAYHDRWGWAPGDQPAYLRDIAISHHMPADPHPSPFDDGIDHVDDEDFFACQSPELLLAWFFRDDREDARRLAERQMRIVVYEVDDALVQLGGRQCTFRKLEARVVGRWNPQEFLEEFRPKKVAKHSLRAVL